ncbi:MAG: cell wall hydrolase [Oscillospiraceae bacterium]
MPKKNRQAQSNDRAAAAETPHDTPVRADGRAVRRHCNHCGGLCLRAGAPGRAGHAAGSGKHGNGLPQQQKSRPRDHKSSGTDHENAETITPEAPEETEPEEQPEEAPEEISRYAALNVTRRTIIDMLAALAWHEARGEPFDGQVAAVLTALNRCLSPEFPDTVEEVVFQKYGDVWQFSPAPYLWTAEPTQTQYDAVYTALHDTDYILPAEAVFFSTKAYNDNIVAVIGNHIFCSIEEVTQ